MKIRLVFLLSNSQTSLAHKLGPVIILFNLNKLASKISEYFGTLAGYVQLRRSVNVV